MCARARIFPSTPAGSYTLAIKMIIPTPPQTAKVRNRMLEMFRIKQSKQNRDYFCRVWPLLIFYTWLCLFCTPHWHHRRAVVDILTALYRCQKGLYQRTSHCSKIIYHSKLTVKLHFIAPRRQTLPDPSAPAPPTFYFSLSLSLPPLPLSLHRSVS